MLHKSKVSAAVPSGGLTQGWVHSKNMSLFSGGLFIVVEAHWSLEIKYKIGKVEFLGSSA